MVTFVILLVLAVIVTEVMWRVGGKASQNTQYVWITAGVVVSSYLADRIFTDSNFHWQQVVLAFVGVLMFLVMHAAYAALRKKKADQSQ